MWIKLPYISYINHMGSFSWTAQWIFRPIQLFMSVFHVDFSSHIFPFSFTNFNMIF